MFHFRVLIAKKIKSGLYIFQVLKKPTTGEHLALP